VRSSNWCSDLGRLVAGCVAFAVSVSAVGVRAAENTASNIDLMQQLTAAVIAELHGKFSPSINGRAVQLKPAGTTEDYLFVTNVFREELTRLGVETIEPNVNLAAPTAPPAGAQQGGAPSAGGQQGGAPTNGGTPLGGMANSSAPQYDGATAPLTLQYQNVVFDLDYVDSHRAFMVGGKRVDRRASVRILTTLSDDTGKVVWVGEASREHSDEIDYGDAARVEQGMYQFNRPMVPSSGWSKAVEPVFVTGVIVGLIYLFFSNQSDN
jgi:hypothetical protein